MGHQHTEAHAGYIKHTLSHHEAHGKEEIRRRDEWEDDQSECLQRNTEETGFQRP